MEKHRAIPHGYMTVGEIAKKMGVAVSTLQYYDKEGVLPPSSESEGGRRLYTNKDIIKLHQIQSMKYLGFSLEDIKTCLPFIDTPKEVSNILTEQAKEVREKIDSLNDVLTSIEKLNAEVIQMETVDWAKYADIIFMLQAKGNSYWLVKHFSTSILSHVHNHCDKKSFESLLNAHIRLIEKAAEFQKYGYHPKSQQGQILAKEWWDFVMGFVNENMSLLPELFKLGDNLNDNEWREKFSFDRDFIGEALAFYLEKAGHDPLEFSRGMNE